MVSKFWGFVHAASFNDFLISNDGFNILTKTKVKHAETRKPEEVKMKQSQAYEICTTNLTQKTEKEKHPHT